MNKTYLYVFQLEELNLFISSSFKLTLSNACFSNIYLISKSDRCILVDENDRVVGHESKYNCKWVSSVLHYILDCVVTLAARTCMTIRIFLYVNDSLLCRSLDGEYWIQKFASPSFQCVLVQLKIWVASSGMISI